MKPKKKKNKTRRKENSFSKNLKLLKGRFPHLWKLVQARKNSNKSPQQKQNSTAKNKPSADHNQKTKFLLYRDHDPIVSVRKVIDKWQFDPYDVIFVIGMGLGYLPVEAIKKGIGNPRMVIIEPSEEIFRNALESSDLEPLLTNDRVDLFIGDEVPIANIVERYQELIPIGKNQIVVHPNYDELFEKTIVPIKQELTERIRAVRDNWFTTKKHGRRMFTNAASNLSSLFAGTPMKNLRGKFKGIPAVCVAAGPSLDHAIPDLKKLQKHVLLIACDSAVNALLKADIRPHIVVTVDIFETNIEKLKPHFKELSETILIYSIESNPDNVRLYLGQKRVAVSAYSKLLLSWIDPALNLQSQFPAMSSVSHMAIFSAMAVGADPIIMVGMDLAYSKGKSHSFDSAFFHSLDQKKLISTLGNKGGLIFSSPQFVADKLLIERVAGQSSVRLINTSINGAYIAGTQVKPLAEIVASESTSLRDASALLETVDWKPVADQDAASEITKNLIQQFVTFKQACSNKKKELIEEIDRLEKISQARPATKLIVDFENGFCEFQEKHQIYKQMIMEIMLSDLEKIFKNKEILSVSSDKKRKDIPLENLKLLARHYEVYEKGLDFQIGQLSAFDDFLIGLTKSKQGFDSTQNDWVKHIQLGRYFVSNGQLWLARREYEACMQISGNQIIAYLELALAYKKAGLWKPAKEVLKKAGSAFKVAPELSQLKNDLETGLDGMFDEIKDEWMQGNMHTTRKVLNQYLNLRPDDPQALELKKVIRELDEEFSGDWAAGEKGKTAAPDMQNRHKQVVQHIKNKQFEQGVGILEGMTEDFPEQSGVFREQIGDIRMMQKDYQSAVWNYRQVMKIDPLKIEIKNKIVKIESLQNRQIS